MILKWSVVWKMQNSNTDRGRVLKNFTTDEGEITAAMVENVYKYLGFR
jgi:hypothetical protein